MSSAIANALSGLTANSTAINVVSNNLANLNTTGYKDEQVSFEDLVNESIAGLASSTTISGSTNAVGVQQFSQGTIETTGNPYDAAIQGGGFFVLQDPSSGQQLLTRQGNFTVNASGDLVTQSGQFVQGWKAVNGVLSTTGPVGNIALPTGLSLAPTATTAFSLNVNLNANATAGAADASFSSPVQVIDAQGVSHTLTVTYTETAPNTWSYAVTIPSADLAAGGAGSTSLASGTLSFNGAGQLTNPAAAAGGIPVAINNLADGASNMNITWNLYDANGASLITQDTATSANLSSTQNGLQGGQLTGLSIGTNGVIVGTFSNGQTINVAQIALASVTNPGSLEQFDGNSWVPTAATAAPVIGMPASGARGQIDGGALESSTVNIASEFTNLLEFERGYQANSKVVTTEDEIVQQTISLIANP
ncbi:MAG TPA: flagellar hook protein FlgE [Bryobacteraceae bacterium]|nr:flagellar hook protein FlgE [Bryobacteraceae bacterium]